MGRPPHAQRSHLLSKGGKPKSQQALNRRGKVAKRKVVKRKISRLDLAKSSVAGGDEDSPAETKDPLKGNEKDRLSSKSPLDKAAQMSKKERKVCRRQQKDDYRLTIEAKSSWERLRRHQLVATERKELMEKLLTAIAGQIHKLSLKHDTARVIQCCLKHGTRSQRSAVFNELKDHIVELSKLKYAKFTVKSLLKYCTALERGHVISALYGHVRRLVRHSEASEILEIAYNDFANAGQRASLMKEFYGPQFSLFKDEPLPTSLSDLLKEKPELRGTVMKHLKEAIFPLLEKKVVKHSIVHRALFEYLNNCSAEERSEMVEAVKEVVVHMLHTKEGSRVAMTTLWHGTTKERKSVIKSFKSYVVKICQEENGHVVMMALFDCVDDTVLVKKAILSEMVSSLEQLCDDQFGRRVLLYLLAPRSSTHFSPQFVSVLSDGDGNAHSKKDPILRQSELRGGVIAPLLDLASRRACTWARSKCHAPLLIQIADSASSDVDLFDLYSCLVGGVCCDISSDSHLVTDASAHWVMKRMLTLKDKGKGLADLVVEKVSVERLVQWADSNRGAFVLSALIHHLERGQSVHDRLVAMLREKLSLSDANLLKGQQALVNELNKLDKDKH